MNSEKKIISRIFWVICVILSVGFCVVFADHAAYKYVTGKFGDYCYTKANANKNIEYPFEYKTLEECGKPFKK